jgi:hypothetical protein
MLIFVFIIYTTICFDQNIYLLVFYMNIQYILSLLNCLIIYLFYLFIDFSVEGHVSRLVKNNRLQTIKITKSI